MTEISASELPTSAAYADELSPLTSQQKMVEVRRILELHGKSVEARLYEEFPHERVHAWLSSLNADRDVLHHDAEIAAANVLYYSGMSHHAAAIGLPVPLYDIYEPYWYNLRSPGGLAPLRRPSLNASWRLLGQRISTPIGVPASAITASAECIDILGASGYNVLTFKTVRSRERPVLSEPNWRYLDASVPLSERQIKTLPLVHAAKSHALGDGSDVGMANSFGVPSSDPAFWQVQVATALSRLANDQLLIVSVLGESYEEPGNEQAQIDDFARVAALAVEAGASNIELNMSWPNSACVDAPQNPLCFNVDLCVRILSSVEAAVPSKTRLIAKLAYMDDDLLTHFVEQTEPFLDAYTAINSVQARVLDHDGQPMFGPGRLIAGVSGTPIHEAAVNVAKKLVSLKVLNGYTYDVIATGGVTDVATFRRLYEVGVDAVQSATGSFVNASLARDVTQSFIDLNQSNHESSPEETRASYLMDLLQSRILKLLDDSREVEDSAISLLAHIDLPPRYIRRALDNLLESNAVVSERGRLRRTKF